MIEQFRVGNVFIYCRVFASGTFVLNDEGVGIYILHSAVVQHFPEIAVLCTVVKRSELFKINFIHYISPNKYSAETFRILLQVFKTETAVGHHETDRCGHCGRPALQTKDSG